MLKELCIRHRNTFPRILGVLVLVVCLPIYFFAESRGKAVRLLDICVVFFLAFGLFIYGMTAPPEMKKKPLSQQLFALCKEFFQRLWPICYFCTPEPIEALYPQPVVEEEPTFLLEPEVLYASLENVDFLALAMPSDASTEEPEAPSFVTQQVQSTRTNVSNEYFLLFESITPEGAKRSFKETLSLLEERYHADNPFMGRTANFYFADGKYIKQRHNGSPIEIRQKTLENRYSSFLNTKKS